MPKIPHKLLQRRRSQSARRKPINLSTAARSAGATRTQQAYMLAERNDDRRAVVDEAVPGTDGDWLSTTTDWADGDWLENNG